MTYIPQPVRTNGWAIAALITALCGLSIAPVICGHVAVAQIRRTGDGGYGLAVAGLILGYLQIAAIIVLLVLTVGFAVWGVNR